LDLARTGKPSVKMGRKAKSLTLSGGLVAES